MNKLMTIRRGGMIGALALAGGLGGCAMPNSSNPTLAISDARVADNKAVLSMQLDNPSDFDVRVESADWSLIYGPLPVAEGSWDLGFFLPSKSSYRFSRTVDFQSMPLDPGAGEVELTGTLDVKTVGNGGNTALHGAGFAATKETSR